MTLSVRAEATRPFSKTVHLSGRLDNDTAPTLDEKLEVILEEDFKVLVLDMGELEYISSAGILSVLKAQKAMHARGGKLALAHLQPPVKKVFEIVKTVELSSVFASVKELDDYLDTIQSQYSE